ncbi:MAG: O-antigen ligase family protein [Bacillota bacterium]|nr:O-antigen ligase family protein [Bacillota bacterium]
MDLLKIIITIFLAVIITLVNIINPIIGIIMVIGCVSMLVIIKEPIFGIITLILMIPFVGLPWLNIQVLGIPGFKPQNIISILVLVLFVTSKKPEPIGALEKKFSIIIPAILTISILRTLSFLDNYNAFANETLDTPRFLLSYLLKPGLFFLLFVLVIFYIRSEKSIFTIFYGIFISVTILSVYIIIYYFLFVNNKTDFETVRNEIGNGLNMHGNDIADFFIITIPVNIAFILHKKSILLKISLILSLGAVAVLYSRTAYMVILICVVLFFIISGRKDKLPPLIFFGGCAGIFVIPRSMINRLLMGISGGMSNLNDISAGRTQDIWQPLIDEYLRKPLSLIFGGGRYSIVHTDAFMTGKILQVGHPHNMYLEMVLDAGLIGLVIYIVFYTRLLKDLVKSAKMINNNRFYKDILYAILISFIGYFISGFSGRSLFPAATNAYIQVLLALGFSIKYLYTKQDLE